MSMRSDTTQTSFYRMFLALCLPLVLQNVITLGVNLADNIMLGSFSQTALSGAAAVNQVQFVYQQLLMALGDGIRIIGPEAAVQMMREETRRLAEQYL